MPLAPELVVRGSLALKSRYVRGVGAALSLVFATVVENVVAHRATHCPAVSVPS